MRLYFMYENITFSYLFIWATEYLRCEARSPAPAGVPWSLDLEYLDKGESSNQKKLGSKYATLAASDRAPDYSTTVPQTVLLGLSRELRWLSTPALYLSGKPVSCGAMCNAQLPSHILYNGAPSRCFCNGTP